MIKTMEESKILHIKPNVIHTLDAQILRQMPEELNQANEEHHPITRQCMHCGKKNGGHYIMCSAWVD